MSDADPWTRRAALLLALGMVLKIAIAATFPLGVDEAYMIGAARQISWSYYDHPPVGFWLPVASASVFGESLLAYRLPFLLCGLATGGLLYLIGAHLGGAKAGVFTLLVFLAAPHMALGSGAFVLPDAPLNLGGALAAYALVRMTAHDRPPLALWALGGAGLMLALASKYQGGLIPLAVLSFILATGRWRWLAQPGFWLAVAMGLVGALPVLVWNLGTDWASFAFHGSRTARSLQPANFAAMLAGQLVYLLPVTFGLALVAVWRARRGPPPEQVLAHLALWPILVFNGIFLVSDASFPHWTMPGFLFALPLVGALLARGVGRGLRWAFLGLGGAIWALVAVLVVHIPTGLLGPRDGFADWDRTEEVFDWSGLAPALRAAGVYDGGQVIVAASWIEAGQMSTGIAMGEGQAPRLHVLGLPHHFRFHARASGAALYLVPDRLDRLAEVPTAPEGATYLGTVALPRGGRPYAGVAVFGMSLP